MVLGMVLQMGMPAIDVPVELEIKSISMDFTMVNCQTWKIDQHDGAGVSPGPKFRYYIAFFRKSSDGWSLICSSYNQNFGTIVPFTKPFWRPVLGTKAESR